MTKLGSSILKWLPLIVALIAAIGSYSVLQYKQTYADSRLEKVETRQSAQESSNTQILVQLGVMQADIRWIKANVSKDNIPYYETLIKR